MPQKKVEPPRKKGLGATVWDILVGQPKPGTTPYLDKAIEWLGTQFKGGKRFLEESSAALGRSYRTGKELTKDEELKRRLREAHRQENIIRGLGGEELWRKLKSAERPAR